MASPTLGPSNSDKSSKGSFSLKNILGDHENLIREEDTPVGGWDEEAAEKPAADGFCIECEGRPSFSCSERWRR
jgi:hypothetical protein